MDPKVSIIIPCKDIDAQTSECIDTCRNLDYDNFEIIVLPDDKRNIGAKNSTGEYLAFIDSDAYPILQKARPSNIFWFINHRVHREKRHNSAFSVYWYEKWNNFNGQIQVHNATIIR